MNECPDKQKVEKLQLLLDKLSTKDEKLYSKNRSPVVLGIENAKLLSKSIQERKEYIFNKLAVLKLAPVSYEFIGILVESLKMNQCYTLIIDDAILILKELNRLLKIEAKTNYNFNRFMSQQIDVNEPRFTKREIKDFLFDETNKYFHQYLNTLNERFYKQIHNEFTANMELIKQKYETKVNQMQIKLKAIQLKAKQNWPNLSFQGKIQDYLLKIYNKIIKINKYIKNGHKFQALGACFALNKQIIRYIDKNLHPIFTLEKDYNNFILDQSNINKNNIEIDDIIKHFDQNQWENINTNSKISIINEIETLISSNLTIKEILDYSKTKFNISLTQDETKVTNFNINIPEEDIPYEFENYSDEIQENDIHEEEEEEDEICTTTRK